MRPTLKLSLEDDFPGNVLNVNRNFDLLRSSIPSITTFHFFFVFFWPHTSIYWLKSDTGHDVFKSFFFLDVEILRRSFGFWDLQTKTELKPKNSRNTIESGKYGEMDLKWMKWLKYIETYWTSYWTTEKRKRMMMCQGIQSFVQQIKICAILDPWSTFTDSETYFLFLFTMISVKIT